MLWFFANIHGFLTSLKITAIIYAIFTIALWVFAIIGIISTISFFIRRKRKKKTAKETPGQKWLRTGRIN